MSEIPPIVPPPGIAQYPRPDYGPPPFDLSVINRAWPYVKQRLDVWIPAMLILVALYIGIELIQAGLFRVLGIGQVRPGELPSFQDFGEQMSISMTLGLLMAIPFAGMYKLAQLQVKGEPMSVGDIFKLDGQSLNVVLCLFLMNIAIFGGMLLCLLPGILVAAALLFSMPILMDRKVNAVTAMKMSIAMVKPYIWQAVAAAFVLGLLGFVGVLACGVGLLVTYPMYFVSVTLMYADLAWRPSQPEFQVQSHGL